MPHSIYQKSKMKNLLLVTSFLLFSFSCQTEKAPQNATLMEVASLTDKKSQRAFLEKIGTSDQAVREQETTINQKYGYDSKEHKEAIQAMIDTDKSPWIVMHHAPKESGTRRRNFKYLYDYYKKDQLEPDRLTFFLARMYNLEFGERIRWNGPFTVQQELDSMINALELREITNEIDKNYK